MKPGQTQTARAAGLDADDEVDDDAEFDDDCACGEVPWYCPGGGCAQATDDAEALLERLHVVQWFEQVLCSSSPERVAQVAGRLRDLALADNRAMLTFTKYGAEAMRGPEDGEDTVVWLTREGDQVAGQARIGQLLSALTTWRLRQDAQDLRDLGVDVDVDAIAPGEVPWVWSRAELAERVTARPAGTAVTHWMYGDGVVLDVTTERLNGQMFRTPLARVRFGGGVHTIALTGRQCALQLTANAGAQG